MDQLTVTAFDLETRRIAAGAIAPKIICGSFAQRREDGEIGALLFGNAEEDGLEETIEWMLDEAIAGRILIVTQNGAYDWCCVVATYPALTTKVFEMLERGGCTDTKWREKLLNLSTTGRLDEYYLPDKTKVNIFYSLAAFLMDYFSLDVSADKEGEDIWRINYGVLDGWPAADYPEKAAEYGKDDAIHTLMVYEAQGARAEEIEYASLVTEEFQLCKSFALRLATAWGMEVDHEATGHMLEHVTKVLTETQGPLQEAGILRGSGRVGPPYAKDEDKAYEILAEMCYELPAEIEDWTPYAFLTEHGIRFKKATGKDGAKDTKVFQEYLAELYQELGEIPTLTPTGGIQCDAEIQEYLAGKDEIMAIYQRRQELSKIVGQMIPVLLSGDVIHPEYDALKETGRTSSYDGGKFKNQPERVFPSVNIQQIPGIIQEQDPRACFKPRDGRVFFDIDFTNLELACVGQVTHDLFGQSVHLDLYNAGIDLHGYLGAQLAINDDGSGHDLVRDFQSACRDEGILSDPMAVYEAFKLLKLHTEEDVRSFFKHFRSFAKPVGLGFPGGLGPATMVDFARTTYGVIMTEEQAHAMREFWRATYPEMPLFFDWVNTQVDPYNYHSEGDQLYWYETPMGMIRRGATFCAAANGKCMQSPGAEAALLAMWKVTRACYDPSLESILFGCRPIAFVHDQIIGETGTDPELWAPQCEEAALLMRQGAEIVLPDVRMRTDEALLTERWSKAADPVRNDQGILVPWRP